MKTTCFIDVSNKNIWLDMHYEPKRLILDFGIPQNSDEVHDFTDVSFGFQLEESGEVVLEQSWPMAGIKFRTMKPGLITSTDIPLKINTDYKLLVWYERKIYRHTAVEMFNSGIPEKPYPSMIWNEELEDWDFIKPPPKNNGKHLYLWNEDKLDWQGYTEEEMEKLYEVYDESS